MKTTQTRKAHIHQVLDEIVTELKEIEKEAKGIADDCLKMPCPICDHSLNKSHCNRCKMTFNPEDLAVNEDWIDRQDQISESF